MTQPLPRRDRQSIALNLNPLGWSANMCIQPSPSLPNWLIHRQIVTPLQDRSLGCHGRRDPVARMLTTVNRSTPYCCINCRIVGLTFVGFPPEIQKRDLSSPMPYYESMLLNDRYFDVCCQGARYTLTVESCQLGFIYQGIKGATYMFRL